MYSQEMSQRLLSHVEVKQFPFLLYPRARECSPTVEFDPTTQWLKRDRLGQFD